MTTHVKETSAPVTFTTPTDREIRIERVFNATRHRVWRAYTVPEEVARWWGRGHRLDVVRMELERGGHWRYEEYTANGVEGFEGRYREVTPEKRLVYTFEWDGLPGHVVIETMVFDELGDGRTRVVTTALFHTTEERDGMLQSGMKEGLTQSYIALERFLAETA